MIVNQTVAVPLLIGGFWGATIVGRELESGTVTLAWTQSTTRRRWLTAKLSTLFVMSAACSGAVAGLVTYWSAASNAVMESRFGGLQFDIQGVVPVGYTLFAAALGLASGVVWRRTLPAMATTVGGFIAVRLIVELFARAHYLSPVVRFYPMRQMDPIPSGSMSIGTDLLQHGQVVNGPVRVSCDGAATRESMNACMDRLGYQFRATYQPAGRYWTFQWIEFGIFAGLAVLLAVAALIVLRRRDA
jgi:ABC-type transport system involved in multi-copper enzyme maturation permease subunit